MMKKLFTLLILVTITFGVFTEAALYQSVNDLEEVALDGDYLINTTFENSDKNCEDKDCNDKQDHCSHRCSGIHNCVHLTNELSIRKVLTYMLNKHLYFKLQYQSRYIEPARRPPSIS